MQRAAGGTLSQMEVQNPMNGESESTEAAAALKTFADVEAALAEGGVTPQQAAEASRVMESLMDQKVAALKAEMGGASFEVESAVRSLVARLTEAPTSWHQSAVFFASSTDPIDAATKKRAPLLAAISVLMVLAQSLVAGALFFGNLWPACTKSSQCVSGTYCSEPGQKSNCAYCSGNNPMTLQTNVSAAAPFASSFRILKKRLHRGTAMSR